MILCKSSVVCNYTLLITKLPGKIPSSYVHILVIGIYSNRPLHHGLLDPTHECICTNTIIPKKVTEKKNKLSYIVLVQNHAIPNIQKNGSLYSIRKEKVFFFVRCRRRRPRISQLFQQLLNPTRQFFSLHPSTSPNSHSNNLTDFLNLHPARRHLRRQ